MLYYILYIFFFISDFIIEIKILRNIFGFFLGNILSVNLIIQEKNVYKIYIYEIVCW